MIEQFIDTLILDDVNHALDVLNEKINLVEYPVKMHSFLEQNYFNGGSIILDPITNKRILNDVVTNKQWCEDSSNTFKQLPSIVFNYFEFLQNQLKLKPAPKQIKVTASELISIVEDYIYNVKQSDLNMGVKFGCDCSCGGDFYTEESWGEMVESNDTSIKRLKELCDQLDIEYDLD